MAWSTPNALSHDAVNLNVLSPRTLSSLVVCSCGYAVATSLNQYFRSYLSFTIFLDSTSYFDIKIYLTLNVIITNEKYTYRMKL